MSLLDTASLIVTPNGYKEGKLYSVIPSDGSGDLSVTRATTATRVNSQGLVELVPYNLVEYSEQFDNTAMWNGSNVSIVANNTTAPNGTLTADKATCASGTSISPNIYSSTFPVVNGSQYTWSFYAKKGSNKYVKIRFSGTAFSGSTVIPVFDLDAGTVVSGVGTIENVGNGWYRCSAIDTAIATNSGVVTIDLPSSTNVWPNGNFNGTEYIYIWGGQVNEGTLKDYQKTETRLNIPRLDYSNGTCPSILVEPQRTNICRDSNNLSGGAWINQLGNSTLTRIQSGGPDGNAFDRLVVGGPSGSNQGRFVQFTTNVGANAVYSIYLKGSGNAFITMYNGISVDGPSITLTNEWTRYEVVSTGGSGTYIDWSLYPLGGSTCDVAFQQVEFATYPTSYIPTTSASVTRNADVISKTGISSLIGQTEGTLFLEVDYQTLSGLDMFISIRPNSSNKVEIYRDGADIYAEVNSSTNFNIFQSKPIGTHKIAFAYKSGSSALYIDGALIGENTTAFTFSSTLSDLFINQRSGGLFIEAANYKSVALWKTRLTNTQLAQLTTI